MEAAFLVIALTLGGFWFSRNSGVRLINNHMRWRDNSVRLAECLCARVSADLMVLGRLRPPRQVCAKRQRYQRIPELHTENV